MYSTTENNLENDSSFVFSLIVNNVAFNWARQLVYMQEKIMQQASKPVGEA